MTKTPNLNLNVPDYQDERWDIPVNENWELLDSAIAGKQNTLTFDSTPISGSSNPVTSGGLYTALLGKANDSAVVKLTGNQTIAGEKTFNNRTRFTQQGPTIRNNNDDWSSTPAEQIYYQWGCEDKNGIWLGGFEGNHLTDGSYTKRMCVRQQNGSGYASIIVGIRPDGSVWTSAPTPATADSSTKIATTAFVKNQGYVPSSSLATCHVVVKTYVNGTSWYRVYDDGWVEQGGFITGSNNAFATVTFLKAFSNTDYTIMCAMQGSTNADRFAQYNNKTTTSVGLYRDDYGTGIAWYACGYGA